MYRTGRGGAGNFYTQEQVEEAAKAQPEDLEAQKPTSPPANPAAHSSAAAEGTYVRAGRGGSGNFRDPNELPSAWERENAAEKTRAAVSASAAIPRSGWSGRGGMGNFVDHTAEREAAEQKKRDALEEKVKLDVEAGLSMPPRTFRPHDRDME